MKTPKSIHINIKTLRPLLLPEEMKKTASDGIYKAYNAGDDVFIKLLKRKIKLPPESFTVVIWER